MLNQVILDKLHRLTGNLRPHGTSTTDDVKLLQRKLSEQLLLNPDLEITGSLSQQEKIHSPVSAESFSHLGDLFSQPASYKESIEPVMVFRRDVSLRSNLLGNSVPQWGLGLEPSESLGPFIDKFGLPYWFDFYFAVHTIQVFVSGNPKPVLLVPVAGTITARTSYTIAAGSVWIASNFIDRVGAPAGYYTGLKIKGGTLNFSALPIVASGQITSSPSTIVQLHLDLNQNTITDPSEDAGFDASEAVVNHPTIFELRYDAFSSTVNADDASCTVFDCTVSFRKENHAPQWNPIINQILIRYSAETDNDDPSVFSIRNSRSKLCSLKGNAKVIDTGGWLLPAAQVDPSQLGNASGTGSLLIGVLSGISAKWVGLKENETQLMLPAIIAEPGLVSVIDFFASNIYGKQKWILWKNHNSDFHSEITLGFEQMFPFSFITSYHGSEITSFFCNHKDSFDRPLNSNGSPFKIESAVGLAMLTQTGTDFRAALVDTNLWFDIKPDQTTVTNAEAYKRYSIALRNGFFVCTSPYNLLFAGTLSGDEVITDGFAGISFGVHLYLPTLPDPYVTNYAGTRRRDRASNSDRTFNNDAIQLALLGVIKWTEPASPSLSFTFVDFQHPYVPPPPTSNLTFSGNFASVSAVKNFSTAGATFNRNIATNAISDQAISSLRLNDQPIQFSESFSAKYSTGSLREKVDRSVQSGEVKALLNDFENHPLLSRIPNKDALLETAINTALQIESRSFSTRSYVVSGSQENPIDQDEVLRSVSMPDYFMLLDVSSNADQMGVSFGTSIRVSRDVTGATNLLYQSTVQNTSSYAAQFPLKIVNMDVTALGSSLRAVTLPQISWEPILNIPLELEAPPGFETIVAIFRAIIQAVANQALFSFNNNTLPNYESAIEAFINIYLSILNTADDAITVMPGLIVYDNDGIPTRIYSESPYLVPVAPLPVTKHFVEQFNNNVSPSQLMASFTLPFAMIAKADFVRSEILDKLKMAAQIHLHQPYFDELHGGLQIKALAPPSGDPKLKPSFPGWTLQLDNVKSFLFGIPATGSTLGKTVEDIFNPEFYTNKPQVPLEKIEFCGYGATMFSNWLDGNAAIAEVSQAKFDVMMGRTAHEVIQVRSIMYPWAVHVVRTITLMRSPNGYVYRSDSGWKAESDGLYDFDYVINFQGEPNKPQINDPYTIHPGVVKGVTNVREIKDYPAAGNFNSSFTLNEPGLPPEFASITLTQWKKLFSKLSSLSDVLPVELRAVVFDADVLMKNAKSGGVPSAEYPGYYKVKSHKMIGYVQLAPEGILIPPRIFADLLNFQNGSIGGSLDCNIDIANSKQRMRIARVDVNPAMDGSKFVFASAARGSLILPKDGSWSVVKHVRDSGDVQPVEEGQSVPLIQKNTGGAPLRIANPADVVNPVAAGNDYGVLQSTGTQKLLFNIPQFNEGVEKLISDKTFFADAYRLLNSKGVFPNIANALGLTNAEKEINIVGEGLMQMANRTLALEDAASPNSLLPAGFKYYFIQEPDILNIYAEYKSSDNSGGSLNLGIDSLAQQWTAAMSKISVVVDLGPFERLMWVDGNFDAKSSGDPKYAMPKLQFGPVLKPVVDILTILASLSGDDFDSGMKVGMSNSPDNWEYKFSTSQEIPVIKFPSPEPPNTPFKLEASLKVGFYFNEVLAIPTDLNALVPACGAYVEFYGRIEVMCLSISAASVYAVGQVQLRIAADTKAGLQLFMKFGFGVELVVGYPVVANVSVLFMVGIEVGISTTAIDVGAFMLFKGTAEILGGLVSVCIQIEAQGIVHRDFSGPCNCIAQVDFSIDVTVLWVIDISYSDSWEEERAIS